MAAMDARAGTLAAMVSVASVILCAFAGCGGDRADPSSTKADVAERMLARCAEDSAGTTATDRRGDTVLERRVDASGQPLRLATGAIIEPFTGASQPWLDLVRVTVKVRSGLLCVAIRRAAPTPKNAAGTYVLRVAPLADQDRQDRLVGPSMLVIGSGVLWLPDGGARVEEAQVDHAYRERGNTISVAVRVDLGEPKGIGSFFSFDRFRWRMRSESDSMLGDKAILEIVDCAPQDAWISYPQGRRTSAPREDDKNLRCPKP